MIRLEMKVKFLNLQPDTLLERVLMRVPLKLEKMITVGFSQLGRAERKLSQRIIINQI
jgi:hypothetical protein